jgi:hypothetical protein
MAEQSRITSVTPIGFAVLYVLYMIAHRVECIIEVGVWIRRINGGGFGPLRTDCYNTRMLDLFEELKALTNRLNTDGVEYALTGGLAMAVYGLPRATVDIHIMVRPEEVESLMEIASDLGFALPAGSMTFAAGKVKIKRLGKSDPDTGDVIHLDILLAEPSLKEAWDTRITVTWEGGSLSVVSREGLIYLKSLRDSGTDRDDIAFLKGAAHED